MGRSGMPETCEELKRKEPSWISQLASRARAEPGWDARQRRGPSACAVEKGGCASAYNEGSHLTTLPL